MTLLKAFLVPLFLLTQLSFSQEVLQFPEGCGNPFVADGVFGDFFEKTIESSVIEAGAVSSSHVNLFAVNRIRKFMSSKYPNPADGEAVDKHIRAQLCSYAKDKQGLMSTSVELHRHLGSISGRMLADVKRLANELNSKERERQKTLEKYERRFMLVEKAQEMADKELGSYLR
jgi:hypothetical protein